MVRCNLSPAGAFGQDARHGAHLDGHPIGRDVLERARHDQRQTWIALPESRAQRIGRFFRAGDRQQYRMASAQRLSGLCYRMATSLASAFNVPVGLRPPTSPFWSFWSLT
jgi:hypothetical protein